MKKHLHVLILHIVIVLFCACQKSPTPETIVREWMGKELVFPDDAVYIVQGDTVQYDPSVNDFNIVVYVDSAGCTECKLRMPAWNAFMAAINQYDVSIGLRFVIAGVETDTITRISKKYEFRHPVLLLPAHIGNFPSKQMYQTFLLDNSNQVVAIGNPISNEMIDSLYRRILGVPEQSHDIEDDSNSISFSSKRVPLGTIRINESKKAQVVMSNHGDSVFVISRLGTSCDCTTATVQSDTIHPNSSTTIDIIQRNDSTIGYFTRDVYVYFENNSTPVQIELNGFMSNQLKTTQQTEEK